MKTNRLISGGVAIGLLALLCAAAPPPAAAPSRMSALQAAVLGLVEGATEYLPVSSTGHLLLAQRIMGLGVAAREKRAADAYAICIQAGAILAVAGLYFARVSQMALGLVGRNPAGLRLLLNVLAAFLPAAVVGLLFEDRIKQHLFAGGRFGFWPIVLAWLVGGVAILAVGAWNRRRKHRRAGAAVEALTWRWALVIGCIQCLAMWPGVSRSLVTIVGGLVVGLSLPAAVEFSFVLGLATLGASTVVDAVKYGPEMLATYSLGSMLVGFAAAFGSAVLAVRWMVGYLQRHGLAVFGWYRIALAGAVAVLILAGALR